jgi:hypothetical protein
LPAPAPHPTFLIIGAERAATRWLRFHLDQHPDICAPPLHLDYFSDPRRMTEYGYRWYRQQFTTFRGEPFVGECSPSYLMWRNGPAEVARRIIKAVPEVRLIAIVRNPIDRIYSAVRHNVRWGRLPSGQRIYDMLQSGDDALEALDPLGCSMMFSSLYPFIDRFGDQLQVMFYDDLVDDPDSFYRSALSHIGASTRFVPDGLERVLFSDADRVDLEPFSDLERQIVFQLFEGDVELLSQWVGRDLSAWYPRTVEDFGDLDFSAFLGADPS